MSVKHSKAAINAHPAPDRDKYEQAKDGSCPEYAEACRLVSEARTAFNAKQELNLTPQQEKFCQCIVSGMNQSDAYRSSYNVRPNTKPESVNVSGSQMMADPKISQRVAELRKPVVEAIQLTREWVLKELIENVKMAKSAIPVRTTDGETGEYKQELPAANKALELLGKELGMFVERKIVDLTTHEATLDELA